MIRDFSHSLPMALLRARDAAMRRFRPLLREHGLTEQQWRVLRALMEDSALEIGELARSCMILMPSMSRILQNLQARKLVRCRMVPSDQRRVRVSVTAAGRALFARVAPLSERRYADLERDFGAANLAALYRLLEALDQCAANPRATAMRAAS